MLPWKKETSSSLPELPCNRLQMKYKSYINRNAWQLEFRKCWRLFCAGDYCSLWESTSRSQRKGFIFLDSILASIHVQWVSLRNVYKWVCETRRECAKSVRSLHNGWSSACKKYPIKTGYEWSHCTCFLCITSGKVLC